MKEFMLAALNDLRVLPTDPWERTYLFRHARAYLRRLPRTTQNVIIMVMSIRLREILRKLEAE